MHLIDKKFGSLPFFILFLIVDLAWMARICLECGAILTKIELYRFY
jgi:hypothetical protein